MGVGVGWGGMLTFMLRWWWYAARGGWGGVGWDVNVHGTLMMVRCSWGLGWGGMLTFMLRWWWYAALGGWVGVGWDVNVHVTLMMLRCSWGLGWGGMLTFMLRWWWYVAHGGWGGVGCWRSCYADDVVERGRNGRFLVAELPHKLVAPSARPPPESKSDVVGTALMKRVHGSATLFADGAKAWKTLAHGRNMKFAEVSHKRMQFCRKRGPRKKTAGTQCIDRKWQSLKKLYPRSLEMWMDPSETACLRLFVAQTGARQTRWRSWLTWPPRAETKKSVFFSNACVAHGC